MKHDAIVEQGIPIHERVPIPDEMIPEDSRVEIDAKIHAGYCKLSPSWIYVLDHGLLTPNSYDWEDNDHGGAVEELSRRAQIRFRCRIVRRERLQNTRVLTGHGGILLHHSSIC